MIRKYKSLRRIVNRSRRSLRFICKHPLSSKNRTRALFRYFLFNAVIRHLPGPIIYPWINDVSFIASPGSGITGNIYTGLEDFEEMGFLLHLLREGDLFLDIGANVGSYTLLASGVCGAKSIAFEPAPETFEKLALNIRLNNLISKTEVHQVALGAERRNAKISTGFGTMNRIILNNNKTLLQVCDVEIVPLDNMLDLRNPTLIKIDVEGFELQVLKGGKKSISKAKAVIIELNSHGDKEEYKEADRILRQLSYSSCLYDPSFRKFEFTGSVNRHKLNTIYIKDRDFCNTRVKASPSFNILGSSI